MESINRSAKASSRAVSSNVAFRHQLLPTAPNMPQVHDSGSPPINILQIDPHRICPSRFVWRHKDTCKTDEFKNFVERVRDKGYENEPIYVRGLPSNTLPHPDYPQATYEVITGHLRHSAYLQANRKRINVIVTEKTDTELACMMLESTSSKRPSPFELGLFFWIILKHTTLKQKDIALMMSMGAGEVSKALAFPELPEYVIELFPSVLELRFNDGPALRNAVASDALEVRSRANAIKARALDLPRLTTVQIVERLTAHRTLEGGSKNESEFSSEIIVNEELIAIISLKKTSITTKIKIKSPSEQDLDELLGAQCEAVRKWVERKNA